MNIIRHYLPRQSLQEFAEEYDLELHVHERAEKELPRYYCHFHHFDVKDSQYSSILGGEIGNGWHEEEAMLDYARRLSGKWGVFDAGRTDARREMPIPLLNRVMKADPI